MKIWVIVTAPSFALGLPLFYFLNGPPVAYFQYFPRGGVGGIRVA